MRGAARLWFPLALGVLGVAVLLALGTWQLRRLEWKQGVIAERDARIAGDPVALPATADFLADNYLPVTVEGALGGEEARVLTSQAGQGPGHRVVSVLTAGERRVLVDLGFVPEGAATPGAVPRVAVTGNLHWPDESDDWTPAPEGDLWFARDVGAMANAMGTEPLLVVAHALEPSLGTTPLPVTSAGIPNDHRTYALTWFALAAVWAAMSALLVRRTLRRTA